MVILINDKSSNPISQFRTEMQYMYVHWFLMLFFFDRRCQINWKTYYKLPYMYMYIILFEKKIIFRSYQIRLCLYALCYIDFTRYSVACYRPSFLCDTTNHHQTINTKGKLETWGWRDT